MKQIGTLISTLFLLLISWCTPEIQAAYFQNGDFSNGDFSGWQGELIDVNLNSIAVDPNSSGHYQIVDADQKARLTLDDTYWQNSLYQDFELDSLDPNESMEITVWLKWSPTSDIDDGLSVSLLAFNNTDQVDLLADIPDSELINGISITRNITSFAATHSGQTVELIFTIWDTDFNTSDTLEIDNISFNKTPSPVPLPGTFLLLCSGLISIGIMRSGRGRNLYQSIV
ncbi:MAG: hypothetical protein GXO58_10510 [Thermodesulfobacteria bacterium]|nr:hypothetical protein [Thermodesulfobacteriota bacterium]